MEKLTKEKLFEYITSRKNHLLAYQHDKPKVDNLFEDSLINGIEYSAIGSGRCIEMEALIDFYNTIK